MKTHHAADDFWVVHGTVRGGQDVSLVVEAPTRAAAECSAMKKGLEVAFADVATAAQVANARAANLLWRYTPEPRLRCLGRPVSPREASCLILCGWAVSVLNLKAQGVPLYLIPPHWFG